jgi:hypothetical protein
MGQILNEELLRIREIMGTLNENSSYGINNLISEQGGAFADLIQGAAGLSRIDAAGISVVDDAVQTATQSLSKTSSSVPKAYNTLEDFADAIVKKEIPENVANDIAQTVIKRIITTPEGSKLIAKTWFADNAPTGMKKAVSKNLDDLPPRLINKIYNDYEKLKGTINTGDASLDDSVKNSLDDAYGNRISASKSKADESIRKANELDSKYEEIRTDVKNKIKNDPDLSTKKIKDWYGTYEDKVKELIETKGEKAAREYLFNQLSKQSIWSRITNKFSGEGWYKTLEYIRKKGVTLSVSLGVITLVGIIIYYAATGLPEKFDYYGGEAYAKVKKQFPVLRNAPQEIIDKFISVVPQTDFESLLLKKEGYSLDYKEENDTPIGDIKTFTVVTPSKTYQYRMDENGNITDESPKKKDEEKIDTGSGTFQVRDVTSEDKEIIEYLLNQGYALDKFSSAKVISDNTIRVVLDGTTYELKYK